MALSYERSEKLDEDAAAFVAHNWLLLDGPNGPMADCTGIAVTVRDGDRIVGALNGWRAGGVAYVSELMIDPQRRGEGIGAELLTQFERIALENGCRRLGLRVQEGTPAQGFYERHGWAKEITVTDWLGGHTYFQMRKDL